MLLAKNCFKKDNILKRGSVRLGSLHEYRATEHKQIADKYEGTLSYRLFFFEGTKLSRAWVNTLFRGLARLSLPGEMHPPQAPIEGPCRVEADSFIWKDWGHDGNTITIKNASATIYREAVNGFIFCMSLVEHENDAIGLFPKYDDCWFVDATHTAEIAEELRTALHNEILQCRDEGNHLIPGTVPLDGLAVSCQHQLVYYIPRDIFIKDQAQITVEELVHRTTNMHLVKPISFSHEKEYRFSFKITSNGNTIQPLRNDVILITEKTQSWAY